MRELTPSVITKEPCHIPLNQSMSRCWSGREEEASGQQIEAGPAEHLALEQLQAVDLPFNGALAPGQRHPGPDSGIILPQSFGKAPEGREGARGGACQPRIK